MPEAVVLEFAGQGRSTYEAVNERLGIDAATGEGEWPPGLLFHAAGESGDGLTVFEVWESREAQAAFMETRLGRALQEGGITGPPTRVSWTTVLAQRNLGG